jgi:hypothetical protein
MSAAATTFVTTSARTDVEKETGTSVLGARYHQLSEPLGGIYECLEVQPESHLSVVRWTLAYRGLSNGFRLVNSSISGVIRSTTSMAARSVGLLTRRSG